MHFALPSNLQTELIAYDPVLKKLARAEKTETSKAKKAKYPLGLPPRLVPTEIIRDSLYDDAIVNINANAAPERFHEFRLPVGTIPNVEYVTHAVIYHWEGLWVAAWLPPKGKESEYVYGYTECYKDTATARKMLAYDVRSDNTFLQEQIGRSYYMIKTVLVTKQMIMDGNDSRHWFKCNGYGMKAAHMVPAIRRFEDVLKTSIPTWDDATGGFFQRLRHDHNLFNLLFARIDPRVVDEYFALCQKNYRMTRDNWQLNVDTLFALIDINTASASAGYMYINLRSMKDARTILDTPALRKWIQSQCNEVMQMYNDSTNRFRRKVIAPLKRIYQLADMINTIHSIWPDTPLDYYQNNIEVLIGTRRFYSPPYHPMAKDWLRQHMPIASVFQILSKHYTERIEEEMKTNSKDYHRRWNWDDDMDHWYFRFNELDDTFSMLTRIFDNGKTITPPKRWRITEFHDHVQAESWKIQNPNHALPQDLFPQPIKINHDNNNWSFFQPFDTHQLAQWGQAVRNCVGNATNYAEGVRKKQHFIVLGMLDGKPTFTIQLKVNNGVMSVEQIVGFANSRLNETTRDTYTEVFRKALHFREDQLKSES
jgi:hypothetical protein